MTTEPTGAADWETFARRDPQYYIDPTLGPGVELETFREGGRGVVDWALAWAVDLPGRGHALEIGCGVGRNTVHLARHFAHVDGVDVSPTMVRSALARGLPANVRLHALSGRDLQPLPDAAYDLVFSHLVFQHIAAESDIASYLRETARVLCRGGVAVLQFDTRPSSHSDQPVSAAPRRRAASRPAPEHPSSPAQRPGHPGRRRGRRAQARGRAGPGHRRSLHALAQALRIRRREPHPPAPVRGGRISTAWRTGWRWLPWRGSARAPGCCCDRRRRPACARTFCART